MDENKKKLFHELIKHPGWLEFVQNRIEKLKAIERDILEVNEVTDTEKNIVAFSRQRRKQLLEDIMLPYQEAEAQYPDIKAALEKLDPYPFLPNDKSANS